MFSEDVLLRANHLGKAYRLYAQPQDRLKHMLLWRFGKSYGDEFWALRDVSFEVKRGEMLGIIGRNGSGKSTLLQILAGTLPPSVGEFEVHGRVTALLELGSGFNFEFSGRENIYLNAAMFGLSPSAVQEKVESIIEFADIGKFIDQPVKLYSSGMFVRLAFAVTTGLDPDILIVDEALAVGDVFFRQKCHQRLRELRSRGVSIIYVTHSLQEVEQLCDRAILLHKGNLINQGNASKIVKEYYLMEQADKTPNSRPAPLQEPSQAPSQPSPTLAENMLPVPEEKQTIQNGTKCLAALLGTESGVPKSVFQQGEKASFFYEFFINEEMEVPVCAILLKNQYGAVVHGKNSLQFDITLPNRIPAGSVLRVRQDVELWLGLGEYTFDLSLASVSEDISQKRSYLPPEILHADLQRVCVATQVGSFAVTRRKEGYPALLSHYGVANLPGNIHLEVLPP